MKHNKAILALLALPVFLLAGCSLRNDSDIARMLNPQYYGSVLPAEAPSTAWPVREKNGTHLAASPDESETIFTGDMAWELRGSYFISEEFSFFVPQYWRDHFEMQSSMRDNVVFVIRTFDFYYYEAESNIRQLVLRIDVLDASFIDDYGMLGGREELGRSSDGQYVYLRTAVPLKTPDGFIAVQEFTEIFTALLTKETFDFQILV